MTENHARAQSSLVGQVLLVGVVVIATSAAGMVVLSDLAEPSNRVFANIQTSVDDGELELVHEGGATIPTDTLRLRVAVNGTANTSVTWASGTLSGDSDDRFEPGERWTRDLSSVTVDSRVSVLLASVDPNDADGSGTVVYRSDDVDGTVFQGRPAGGVPTAEAGGNKMVRGENGESVELAGSATEPDGDDVAYEWRIVDDGGIGDPIRLVNADTPTPEFKITGNVTEQTEVVVRLETSDVDGATIDDVVVTVTPVDGDDEGDDEGDDGGTGNNGRGCEASGNPNACG